MNKNRFTIWAENFFFRTMCPRPDGRLNLALGGWPYNFTGKISGYFHKINCERCHDHP